MEYRNIHFYAIFFLFFSSFLIASFHSLVERGLIQYNSGCSSSINDFESIEDLRNHLESVALAKCDEIIFSIMGLSLANINSLISFSLVLFNIYFILRLYGSKN
jgi:disulfide bond formation protein DsbB